ncbi:hypothetical protein [Methanolobus bombayensis]|uniref:hypothetical protein n=1 Tax=Methanolobus bombayensis TaxID=38023 RepID=UPI001AE21618|nr:hypothetical protein [Methanolobus bombayensis]
MNKNPLFTSLYPISEGPSKIPLKILMTTFDSPDPNFLLKDLLPKLLKLQKNGIDEETFPYHVYDALERTDAEIISSVSSFSKRPDDYIFRKINLCKVGCNKDEVQHSKLCLIYSKDEENEFLDIAISSANLSRSAFEDQLQAAWKYSVKLSSKNTYSRSWGVLPRFLSKLSESCGQNEKLCECFIKLLKRAKPPENVIFLASVPGTYDNNEYWGSNGLKKINYRSNNDTRITIFSPFVGSWDKKQLKNWKERLNKKEENLELIWINKNHKWAEKEVWKMPENTFRNLSNICKFKELEISGQNGYLHCDQEPNDNRWSHAKLYFVGNENDNWLILTSANFTQAAWGKITPKQIRINNFELGVALKNVDGWPPETVDMKNDCYYTEDEGYDIPDDEYVWSEATWDGQKLEVLVRSDIKPNNKVIIQIASFDRKERKRTSTWENKGKHWIWSKNWSEKQGVPHIVTINNIGKDYLIPILNLRDSKDMIKESIPELGFSDEEEKNIYDDIVYKRYSSSNYVEVVEKYHRTVSYNKTKESRDSSNYDYGVLLSRDMFKLVDNWNEKRKKDEYYRVDGYKLSNYFARLAENQQNKITRIAAELCKSEIDLILSEG